MRYAHTNNSEKLYFEFSKTIKPSTVSGKRIITAVIFMILSADFRNFLHRITYISCPPSSDITGSILKVPYKGSPWQSAIKIHYYISIADKTE